MSHIMTLQCWQSGYYGNLNNIKELEQIQGNNLIQRIKANIVSHEGRVFCVNSFSSNKYKLYLPGMLL